jgi:hypothetical protein
LRDTNNKPHVTAELTKDKNVRQIVGKQNTEPKEKYRIYIWNWLRNFIDLEKQPSYESLISLIRYAPNAESLEWAVETLLRWRLYFHDLHPGFVVDAAQLLRYRDDSTWDHKEVRLIRQKLLPALEKAAIEIKKARVLYHFARRVKNFRNIDALVKAMQDPEIMKSLEYHTYLIQFATTIYRLEGMSKEEKTRLIRMLEDAAIKYGVTAIMEDLYVEVLPLTSQRFRKLVSEIRDRRVRGQSVRKIEEEE